MFKKAWNAPKRAKSAIARLEECERKLLVRRAKKKQNGNGQHAAAAVGS